MGDVTQKQSGSSGAGSSSDAESAASLPKAEGGRQGLLSEVSKRGVAPHQGPSVKDKLIDSYLKGEISLGELTFHLKAYNSVVADSVLRDSKNHGASQINVSDASRAGAGISKAGLASALEEKGDASNSSDDALKKQQEVKIQEKVDEKEQEQAIIAATLFERESRDLKKAQRWRELEKLQKEEAEDYQERKLEEELLVAPEALKNSKARDREMKSRAQATKRSANDATSGGGKRAGR